MAENKYSSMSDEDIIKLFDNQFFDYLVESPDIVRKQFADSMRDILSTINPTAKEFREMAEMIQFMWGNVTYGLTFMPWDGENERLIKNIVDENATMKEILEVAEFHDDYIKTADEIFKNLTDNTKHVLHNNRDLFKDSKTFLRNLDYLNEMYGNQFENPDYDRLKPVQYNIDNKSYSKAESLDYESYEKLIDEAAKEQIRLEEEFMQEQKLVDAELQELLEEYEKLMNQYGDAEGLSSADEKMLDDKLEEIEEKIKKLDDKKMEFDYKKNVEKITDKIPEEPKDLITQYEELSKLYADAESPSEAAMLDEKLKELEELLEKEYEDLIPEDRRDYLQKLREDIEKEGFEKYKAMSDEEQVEWEIYGDEGGPVIDDDDRFINERHKEMSESGPPWTPEEWQEFEELELQQKRKELANDPNYDPNKYKKGDIIYHQMYGKGEVIDYIDDSLHVQWLEQLDDKGNLVESSWINEPSHSNKISIDGEPSIPDNIDNKAYLRAKKIVKYPHIERLLNVNPSLDSAFFAFLPATAKRQIEDNLNKLLILANKNGITPAQMANLYMFAGQMLTSNDILPAIANEYFHEVFVKTGIVNATDTGLITDAVTGKTLGSDEIQALVAKTKYNNMSMPELLENASGGTMKNEIIKQGDELIENMMIHTYQAYINNEELFDAPQGSRGTIHVEEPGLKLGMSKLHYLGEMYAFPIENPGFKSYLPLEGMQPYHLTSSELPYEKWLEKKMADIEGLGGGSLKMEYPNRINQIRYWGPYSYEGVSRFTPDITYADPNKVEGTRYSETVDIDPPSKPTPIRGTSNTQISMNEEAYKRTLEEAGHLKPYLFSGGLEFEYSLSDDGYVRLWRSTDDPKRFVISDFEKTGGGGRSGLGEQNYFSPAPEYADEYSGGNRKLYEFETKIKPNEILNIDIYSLRQEHPELVSLIYDEEAPGGPIRKKGNIQSNIGKLKELGYKAIAHSATGNQRVGQIQFEVIPLIENLDETYGIKHLDTPREGTVTRMEEYRFKKLIEEVEEATPNVTQITPEQARTIDDALDEAKALLNREKFQLIQGSKNRPFKNVDITYEQFFKAVKYKLVTTFANGLQAWDAYELGLLFMAVADPAIDSLVELVFPHTPEDDRTYFEQVMGNLDRYAEVSPTEQGIKKNKESRARKFKPKEVEDSIAAHERGDISFFEHSANLDRILDRQKSWEYKEVTPNIGRTANRIHKNTWGSMYGMLGG